MALKSGWHDRYKGALKRITAGILPRENNSEHLLAELKGRIATEAVMTGTGAVSAANPGPFAPLLLFPKERLHALLREENAPRIAVFAAHLDLHSRLELLRSLKPDTLAAVLPALNRAERLPREGLADAARILAQDLAAALEKEDHSSLFGFSEFDQEIGPLADFSSQPGPEVPQASSPSVLHSMAAINLTRERRIRAEAEQESPALRAVLDRMPSVDEIQAKVAAARRRLEN